MEHVLGGVPLDGESERDLSVAVALRLEAEDAVEVDVSGHGRANLGQVDLASRGDVGEAGGEARGEGVEDELDGCRAVVPADEEAGWPASNTNRARGSAPC